MKKYLTSALFIVSFFAAFWAYIIIDSLLREFSGRVTFIDLVVLFILGFISGISAGILIHSLRSKKAVTN